MSKNIKICIDAGHYGKYNAGAVKGYWESEIVWDLHLLQKKYLEEYEGVSVELTRSNQAVDRGLYARGAEARGCDLFISDHTNAVAGAPQVDRPVVIVTLNGKATALGNKLANVIRDVMDTNDPSQVYTKKNNSGTDWYGVLRGAAAVGVGGMIIEHSFHTNERACKWLMDSENLKKLAKAEADCIAKHYGMKKKGSVDTDPEEPVKPSEPEKETIAVDGSWGPATTKRSQEYFGTTVDGIISNQPTVNKKYLYSADESSWEFKADDYDAGSELIRALQKFLGDKEYYEGKNDGYCGAQTVTALQEFLADKGYYAGKIDGSMGPETVKGWQKFLNAQ